MTTVTEANGLTDLEAAVCLEMAEAWAKDAGVMAKAVPLTPVKIALERDVLWRAADSIAIELNFSHFRVRIR